MSNKIKAVNIIGHNVNSKNNLPGVVTIGDKENGVTVPQISFLNGKINSNIIIFVNMHGEVRASGEHYMMINKDQVINTSDLLSGMKSYAPGPLQIEIISCYSGNAKNDVKHLSAGSVLITNSKENSVSLLTLSNLEFSQFFKEYSMESNPYLRFLKMMFIKASSYSAFNTQLGKFEISPNHNVLLSANSAKKFLEEEAEKFIKFSEDKIWNGNPVKLPSIKFSDEQIDIFVKNLFLYECSVNKDFYKFLEENLSKNEYLKESINYSSDGGISALYVASEAENLDLVRALIDNGANVDKGDKKGITALILSSEKGRFDIVDLLLKEGADLHQARNDGLTALHMASKKGHTDIVKLLLKKGADVNKVGEDGQDALFLASESGHPNVVELLLEASANIDKKINDGRTALLAASWKGNFEVVRLLVYSNAKIDEPEERGVTPILIAAQHGHFKVVQLLIQNGSDVNKPANDGVTPIIIASQNGHTDVVKLLIDHRADLDKPSKHGSNALFAAVFNGHIDIVKLLLEGGADINKAVYNGYNLLDIAIQEKHFGIEKLLKKHIEELKSVDSDQETLSEDYYNDLFSHDSVGEATDHTDEL